MKVPPAQSADIQLNNMDGTTNVDRLSGVIARTIRGEVRFDSGARAAYASDASNYRQVPLGVVIPRSLDDVVEAVRVCKEFDAPVLLRGGGTSQNGQCVNVAVVIDASKYLNRVLAVDEDGKTALVEPGVVCDVLRDAAERHHLTFGPDPATHSRCTLGGMIGNNSCGAHSMMAGKTVENIDELEILTYDGARFWVGPTSEDELESIIDEGGRRGEIYARLKDLRDRYADLIRSRFPRIKRRVSGYNLDQLLPENGFNVARALVGSEGTCVVTLQAKVRLVHSPQCRVLIILGYPDIYSAADAVPSILPFEPIAMEGLDYRIIGGLRERGLRLDDIAMLPEGNAWLMVEFGAGTVESSVQRAKELEKCLARSSGCPSFLLVEEQALQVKFWSIRETGASATALNLDMDKPDPVVGWEDAAVDPLRLGDYLREFQALVDKYDYETSLYGHFGDGCIHARIDFDLRTEEGIAIWRKFLREAAELVVKFGGSLSGEHGDGQAKAEFLPIMYGEELMQAFREFKAIWDPSGMMNPGKLVDAYRADENLRMGPDYRPVQLSTVFSYAERDGGFSRAVERCIGMGKCRAKEGGVMCPSYRATGDELHSTRGRSRLLFEMLRGEVIDDGWRSEAVKEALDSCLSCKGCRSDCPTHVDMATYKAEFLSGYYANRPRPIQAYSMGMVYFWARFASLAPRVFNRLTGSSMVRPLLKKLAGIDPRRQIPKLALRTFRSTFERKKAHKAGRRVVLWPDTFNDHFKPETAWAAAVVLEKAGYDVELPSRRYCCGRTLYDFGMLDKAKAKLKQIMIGLRDEIEAGIPIVGLEPACVSVFRDELPNLFPHDELAAKLSRQVYMFSEFLGEAGFNPPKLERTAIVHIHCHHKSVLGSQAEIRMLRNMGIQFEMPEEGCCGMAGAYGFKPEHYESSMRLGEKALLHGVEKADEGTLIIVDGYSCREQIEQSLSRKTMHLAEVMQMALHREENEQS